jgi:hypothetical protein
MKNYVNIMTSNQAKRVHYPSIYFEVVLSPTDLSFERFIEWRRVSMKKFEKSRTIEKYILIYTTKAEELIYNKRGYIK